MSLLSMTIGRDNKRQAQAWLRQDAREAELKLRSREVEAEERKAAALERIAGQVTS